MEECVVKLGLYITFCKNIEFKRYPHGSSDTGTRLLFQLRLRSETHSLKEELGRQGQCLELVVSAGFGEVLVSKWHCTHRNEGDSSKHLVNAFCVLTIHIHSVY